MHRVLALETGRSCSAHCVATLLSVGQAVQQSTSCSSYSASSYAVQGAASTSLLLALQLRVKTPSRQRSTAELFLEDDYPPAAPDLLSGSADVLSALSLSAAPRQSLDGSSHEPGATAAAVVARRRSVGLRAASGSVPEGFGRRLTDLLAGPRPNDSLTEPACECTDVQNQ